jgi:tetratricopeptide (TPR) repeat protein
MIFNTPCYPRREPMANYPLSDAQTGMVKKILFLIVVAAILFVIGLMHWIKDSDAFKTAEAFVRENPEIKAVTGDVKSCDLRFPFDYKTSNGTGRAEFGIHVEGTRDSTKAYVTLRKQQNQWAVVSADYEDRDGRKKPLLRPEKTPVGLTLAHNYFKQKNFDKAIEAYGEYLRLHPADPQAYYWRGRAYWEKKQPDRAVTDFKKVIELKRDYVSAYDWLGWISAKQEKYDDAIRYLTRSIELKPDRAWAYYQRGRCYFKKNNREQALKDVKKSCDLGYKEGCTVYESMKKKS